MTKDKRISQVFKRAIPFLWDGISCGFRINRHEYICHAIYFGNNSPNISAHNYHDVKNAIAIINDRLGDDTLYGWLIDQGIPSNDLSDENVQAHRLAWLKMLVKEFNKK